METPNILINQRDKSTKKFPSRKIILIIFFALVGIMIAYFLVPKMAHYLPFLKNAGVTSQVQPKLIKQTTLPKLSVESHPTVYTTVLSYDLKKGIANQVSISKIQGDPPALLPTPPKVLPGDFLYELRISSAKGDLINSGFKSIPADILNKKGDQIFFRIAIPYAKDAIIRTYISDKLIWSGKIE